MSVFPYESINIPNSVVDFHLNSNKKMLHTSISAELRNHDGVVNYFSTLRQKWNPRVNQHEIGVREIDKDEWSFPSREQTFVRETTFMTCVQKKSLQGMPKLKLLKALFDFVLSALRGAAFSHLYNNRKKLWMLY